ncbi:hypothetical protein BKA67DRAFT_13824 [Truncatella angustata]|uniref:F-box domain-containing protein n=1 Tax=Truncatella angustata TaxID=152316 RepID=A0A9P8UW57_9PEZI|nr:uncharacterized protein BKA67DRAFT_13824 [Truncatella angustata]KAH6659455.1 hypothetical protein BKA67DRAFT_13824 [Truncatella angustata]
MASSLAFPSAKLGILGLPVEIIKEICSHCSQSDLICLALVSRQFHELAASQLYRNFHIVFPDEDDPTFDSPIDGLASGLDTFVTSDYDYAKHLHDLSLDTLSAGARAEQAYKPYLYKVSCGKFMNTLLLLVLRRATSLETFKWNIRVELSRPVYKALHNITSLKHLHLRMQSGYSLYETPPPLPWSGITATSPSGSASPAVPLTSNTAWTNPSAPSPLYSTGSNAPFFGPVPSTTGPWGLNIPTQYTTYAPPPIISLPPNGSHAAMPTPPKPPFRAKPIKKSATTKEPLTIAGFNKLHTLSVLDIDSLDIIAEIQACIQNSSSQLRKLKLSFSDGLASQARKPKVEVDPNESDDDDEFQIVPMTTSYDDGTGPARAFRAQQERKAQELVLGRVFAVDTFTSRTTQLVQRLKTRATEKAQQRSLQQNPVADRQNMFLSTIQLVSKRLCDNTVQVASEQKEILDLITAASKLYVEDVDKDVARTSQGIYIPPSWLPEAGESSSSTTLLGNDAEAATASAPPNAKPRSSLQEDNDDTEPEDIDVAKPEEQLNEDVLDTSNDDLTPKNEPSLPSTAFPTPSATNSTRGTPSQASSATPSIVAAAKETVDRPSNTDNMFGVVTEPSAQSHTDDSQPHSYQDVQHEINVIEAELEELGEVPLSACDTDEEIQRQVSEYVRATRGIALKSLSIHLIPVKASVLGRAIDLRTLTRITLLNVGNQAPIWALMTRENKAGYLPLRKIFTDNVSSHFLNLVSQLETVEELFLLERSLKYKPESFAPRTEITLDQIRRAILKKHMRTIKRLMIKNQKEGDNSWDMDEKTIQLICKRGKGLEELAINTGISAIHAFLQHLTGLSNLRALHILFFRVEDTCLSVMRETRRFIVDTISHHPEMLLEWIAMGDDNRADRLVRRTDKPRRPMKKNKSKEKELVQGLMNTADPALPILPTDAWDDSSSESEFDDDGGQPYLKLDLIENICFYDIWGVRIFKKEVVAARL